METPGRQPSTSRTRTEASETESPWGMNGRRTNDTAMAITTNVAALKPTVQAGPTHRASSVPRMGPTMRPLFHEYTPSDTMAINSSGGTRSGCMAPYDGAPVAPAALPTRMSKVSTKGVRTPRPSTTARPLVAMACAINAQANTLRRS